MEEKDSQDITIKKSHLYLLAALMIAVIGIFISYNLIVKNAQPKNLAPQTSYTGFSSGSQNQIAKLQGAVEFNNAIGKKAPDFSLESLDGSMVKLSDYLGKTIVLFFSEGSMCYPSCWNQIEQLSSDGRFNSNDVRLMGRASYGVTGIKLDKGDDVVSLEVLSTDTILTITNLHIIVWQMQQSDTV